MRTVSVLGSEGREPPLPDVRRKPHAEVGSSSLSVRQHVRLRENHIAPDEVQEDAIASIPSLLKRNRIFAVRPPPIRCMATAFTDFTGGKGRPVTRPAVPLFLYPGMDCHLLTPPQRQTAKVLPPGGAQKNCSEGLSSR